MSDKKRNIVGLAVVGAFGTAAVGLLVGCVPFVLPALRKICLPYVPATDNQISNVLKILRKRKGSVIDLGSGDGRIVLAAATLGYSALGVELNPWLIFYSKIRAFNLGLSSHATFKRQNIWKTDLGKFQNIIIFGVEQMMPQLEEKLKLELKENSCVIACRFPLPNWQSVAIEGAGIDTVWLYEKKAFS